MAGQNTVEHKLRLLIETELEESQKQKVGKQLKGILEGAAIGFDEAETKKNLVPIVRMIQRLFDKAEMKFDADKLLGMPSQQALQKIADITADDFQAAFDRALAKSGGIKIDFGNMDLSGMTEPLERVTEELIEINRKIANETKKSVDDIASTMKGLDRTVKRTKKVTEDGVEKKVQYEVNVLQQTIDKIESTLNKVNNPKALGGEKGAISALKTAASAYEESVKKGDPWETQYQHMITFVSKYEAMAEKIKPLVDTSNPEFKALYDVLSPKAGAAKISLQHFVDIARGNELSEYKGQPWARENTLKEVRDILKGGISVKDGGGEDRNNNPPKEPPRSISSGDVDKYGKLNIKVPLTDMSESDAERAAKQETAEATRKAAEAEKALAEARKISAKTVYRVVYPPLDEEDLSRSERKSQYGGAEIWTSSSDVADTYATGEEDPVKLQGSISANNAYIIDAEGATWKDFNKMKVLSPDGVDEDGKVKFAVSTLREAFPELFSRIDNKEFDYEEDIQTELYKLIHSLGYDSVVTRNVIDAKDTDYYKEPSTIYAVFDDAALKVLGASVVEEQDEDGVTTFEERYSRENIPEFYKMPEASDIKQETVAHQENTTAIVAETQAAEQLNAEKIESQQIDAVEDMHKTPAPPKPAVVPDEIPIDTSEEQVELGNLKGSIDDVTTAVNTKTEAFKTEGIEVGKVVDGEIAKLGELESKVNGVKANLEGLLASIKTGSNDIGAGLSNITVNVNHQNAEDVKIDATALADAISKIQVAPDNEGLIAEIKALVPSLGNLVAQEDTLQAIKAILETKDTPVAGKVPPEIKAETSSKRENRFERLNDIASLYEDVEDVDAAIKEFGELYKEIVLIGESATKTIKPNKTGINTLKKIANGDIDLGYDYSWVEFKRNSPSIPTGKDTNASTVSIDENALRQLLDSIVYNVKIVHDDNDRESNKIAIDEGGLKNVLRNLVYNVKITHDDADKQANKITLDEGALESTLKRVFTNIINPPTEQNDLAAIKTAIEAINNKISGKISGVVKSESDKLAKIPTERKKHKDGTISHGAAEGESGSMQKLFDYYYWIEEQIEQFKNNELYVAELQKVQARIVPKLVDYYKELESSGKEDPAWMAPLNEKHNLHMSKIRGGEMQSDAVSTEKKVLGLLKEEYKLKREIFTLEQKGATKDDIAPLQEKLGIYQSIREALEINMTDDELLRYATAATKEVDKGEHQLTVKQITANIQARKAELKAVEKETNAKSAEREKEIKSLASGYEKLGKLRAKFEGSGDLEAKEELRILAEQVKKKKESLKLTTDEVLALREKSDEAYKTEQRLIQAAKEQQRLSDQRKAADKDTKKQAANDKKIAQREAMLGKAGNAVGRAENTWMNAVGIEGELPADFVEKIDDYYQKLDAVRKMHQELKNSDMISEEQKKELIAQTMSINKMTEEIGELVSEYQRLSGDNTTVIGTSALGSGSGLGAYEQQLKQAVAAATNGKAQIKNFDAATKTLTYTVKTGSHEFTEYTAAVRRADGALVSVQGTTKRTETFIEATTRKMKELTSYFSGMAIFNRVGQELRRGIQYVREIDLALTELKKVTDETEEEYDQFLQTAAKTGSRLGTTISAVTEATATFAKLGYTMEQATEMAESAIVYKNVGDNIASTGDAADSIISTMKGFRLEASESMAIVDRFNEVGNRFAITSQGIGEALRLSASALSEGGNSLDESIALITAANEVVNDPSSVGTALKTLTLRLRGSKTELEEMGEDVSDMATTTSQLQAKLLALTGGQVDIMLDANTFKNSTQILREMAEAWEDMNDIQRASALELMGGKRQANVLSALIQNFDTVEDVIETSANSAGSALKENERYLDSIQGKIDQFNNSMQAMWSNTLDSDVVKGFVAFGTELIKIIDKIGLLNSVLIGFGIFAAKKYDLLGSLFGHEKDIKSIQNEYEKLKKKAEEATEVFNKNPNKRNKQKKDDAINNRDDYYKINVAPQEELINKQAAAQKKLEKAQNRLNNAQAKAGTANAVSASTMKQYESAVRSAEREVTALNEEVKEKVVIDKIDKQTTEAKVATTWKELAAQIMSGQVTKDNIGASIKNILVTKLATTALGEKVAAILGVTTAELVNIPVTQLLTTSFSALAGAIWTALAPLLPFIAAAAAVVGAVVLLAKGIDSVWVTAGEAKEKLEELNSEIDDLTSDLDSLNSELETTQERMEELLSKDSLSFTEQEELKNLRLQNEYLERQIELQELILKNKKEARLSTAQDVVEKTWNNKSYGKEDYQIDWDDSVIKKDNFWSLGMSGKSAIDGGLKAYAESKALRDVYRKVYMESVKELGSEHWLTKDRKRRYDESESKLTNQAGGINMVLGDMSNIISENELQYGQSDEIDKFLDEYYAMTLKWQEAQGLFGKSDIIKSIFSGADKDTQSLKKQIDEIADSDLDNAEKQTKAQELIQDALDATDGSYRRLQNTINILGMSADELAASFIAMSDAPDISTPDGVAEVYQDGINILNKYKNARNEILGQDENGENITWNNLFTTDEDGKKVADNLKIASILEGSDEAIRQEFTKMVEAVENGEMEVDAALAKWNVSGFGKVLDNLNNEFESVNNEMFANIADDIHGLIDTVSELQSALEDVAGTIDLLSAAEEQMANSGQISVKTALDLMETTDDYSKVVTVQNGVLKLATGAQEYLTQSKFNSIKTQLEASAALAENTYQTALASNTELDYADNANVVMTAESIKAEAIGRVSAVVVALGAAMDEIMAGNFGSAFSSFGSTYKSATATVVAQSNAMKTSIAELQRDAENKRALADVYSFADDYESFKNNYDFDKTPGDKYGEDEDSKTEEKMDAFQKAMDYWENRIAANQARYDQLQNEIDLLESKGQKASTEYYQEQIGLLQEFNDKGVLVGGTMHLLAQKRSEAYTYLKSLEEGSEEWWEVANVINDIESEIDEVTASVVDLQDAMAETEWYKYEEFGNRLDDITSKLETIRDLIAPGGEEEWFDDQGQWTEEGVAVLGTYIQELETYKSGLAETADELKKYNAAYSNSTKAYYANLGIHSEQEYYDKAQELTEQQYDYVQSISDTEQSVVDMYESNIDAVEEYTDKLVDSYNDYIDSVKEALDAERDLYNFKKNIKKQTKDIAAIERRIASLSGSTNASDIAERRRLEADLYGAREELDDTYYEHAKETQQEALDNEAEAYEETMNRFIEGLRLGLDQATANMDEFLMSVTSLVTLNAEAVLAKYEETELPLGDAITNPWKAAIEKVGKYDGDALALINKWTQGGFFDTYKTGVSSDLSSPWSAGSTAADAFKNSVDTVMDDVVEKIQSNVKTASDELSELYSQILDTEKRAKEINVDGDGNDDNDDSNDNNNSGYVPQSPLKSPTKAVIKDPNAPIRPASPKRPTFKKVGGIVAGKGQTGLSIGSRTYSTSKFNSLQVEGGDGIYFPYTENGAKNKYVKKGEGYTVTRSGSNYKIDFHSFKPLYTKHATGTTGTKRDEWAITDEPQFGDELVLVPGKDGNLSFMRKGTGVVPADLTEKIFELAQIPTSDLMSKNMTAIVPNITKNDFKSEVHFDSLVHVDHCDQNTLKDLEKMMDNKINDFSRQMNYSLKKFAR